MSDCKIWWSCYRTYTWDFVLEVLDTDYEVQPGYLTKVGRVK